MASKAQGWTAPHIMGLFIRVLPGSQDKPWSSSFLCAHLCPALGPHTVIGRWPGLLVLSSLWAEFSLIIFRPQHHRAQHQAVRGVRFSK